MSAYISISIRDGITKPIKGILCDQDDFPMVFNDRLQAIQYYTPLKSRLDSEYGKDVRGSAKLIPVNLDGDEAWLDDLLDLEDLKIVKEIVL